jgi:hypothetical protein
MRRRPIEDHEYPDPDENDDEDDLIPCPSCGRPIFDDAEQCPHCGDYVVAGSTSPLAGKPAWYVLLALMGILAVIALSFL